MTDIQIGDQAYRLGDAPAPALIKAARAAAGQTQRQAAAAIYRPQPRWAEYEAGVYRMDPAVFAWYLSATRQIVAAA